jgi:hypothetical protein
MNTTTNDEQIAAKVIARYEQIVRANNSPEWDTIVAVAECQDGIMGAYGEVLDVSGEMGYGHLHMDDHYTGALDEALLDLQDKLRAEVAAR